MYLAHTVADVDGDNFALTASQMLNPDAGRVTDKQAPSQILQD
jgi:hypothetical protein